MLGARTLHFIRSIMRIRGGEAGKGGGAPEWKNGVFLEGKDFLLNWGL